MQSAASSTPPGYGPLRGGHGVEDEHLWPLLLQETRSALLEHLAHEETEALPLLQRIVEDAGPAYSLLLRLFRGRWGKAERQAFRYV